MPIHDLGYRRWEGPLCPETTRWCVIAQTGVRLAWKSHWLRRMMLVAWLPAVYMGIAFFAFEQSASRPAARAMAVSLFRDLAGQQGVALYSAAMQADPGEARHQVWGWLLLHFFRYPQGVLMALVVGLIAPPLISQDVRSRALLLYFSRPITRSEYILGKSAVVCVYVALITTAPALGLYLFGVLLSPDLSVVNSTWDFLLRIPAASAVVMIPTTMMALAFSSVTTRSYYASFAWFATWGVGMVTYYSLRGVLVERFDERWSLVSVYHTLGKVQAWIFNIGVTSSEVLPYLLLLSGLSVVSLAVVFRRVSSCLRL
jgi:ABC-2 type transport system permease protein